MCIDDSRPFRTIEEQLERLEKRGLNIENKDHSKKVLLAHNYYCVVNGYKAPFLKYDSSLKPIIPECYKENTRFSEIFNLYKMDKELRILFLSHILSFENKLKALIAYHFSNAHPEKYAYLHFSNYSDRPSDLSDVLKNIQKLSNKIEYHKNLKRNNAIKHYTTKHGNVPLWVLANFLTFGELQYLFLSLEQNVKNNICKVISLDFKNEMNSDQKIDDEELKMIIKTANLFRNVCAHDEVLYNYAIGTKIKSSLFKKYFPYNDSFKSKDCHVNLFIMLSLLKLTTTNKDYKKLLYELDKIY